MVIDHEKFIRSDYNTLINVVSSSQDSLIFKRINPRNSLILESVQIQDGKYSDPTYTRARYDGSKSESSRYTFYTIGDTSYGKNASIDINTYKFAWANNINSRNLNFYDKTTINIRYLIDPTGSVTELSTKNSNLFEVQNLYKKGDKVSISMMDKYTPTNQSNLDGDKEIYEGGFSYSPIIFREVNENLNFLYLQPKDTTTSRLGVKTVLTSSYLFQTIGNPNTNFNSLPDANTIFKIDGISETSTVFSFNQVPSSEWPYSVNAPLNTGGPYKRYDGTLFNDPNPKVEYNSNYYTLDWFTPFISASAEGGYVTNDSAGAMKTNRSGGQYYQYFQALRDSTYIVNINIPLKITYASNNRPEWSTFKVLAILEKQAPGNSSWNYVGKTKLRINRLPETDASVGVDEETSSIFMDDTVSSIFDPVPNPYIQVSCILNDAQVNLIQGEKLRLKFYFAEMRNVFLRTNGFYFEIQRGDVSNSYFEVYDEINSGVVAVTGSIVPGSPDLFTVRDNQYLDFNESASLLYEKAGFVAPEVDNSGSIATYYSPVEPIFTFSVGDLLRFTSYFTPNPELYSISQVKKPKIAASGSQEIVMEKLSIKLDRLINSNKVNSRTFAILKKKADETSVIVNFKKNEGATSNALLLPFNLEDQVRKNTGNIIAPLKDGILAKVVYISP
jgi:hypothetical protein